MSDQVSRGMVRSPSLFEVRCGKSEEITKIKTKTAVRTDYQTGFVPLGADGQPMQPDPNGQSGLHPPHPPPYYPLHPAYPPFAFPPGAGYPMMGHPPGMASTPHSHAGPSGEIMNGEGEVSGSRKDGDASPPRKKKREA